MEEKEEKKTTDYYVPVVVAITLRSTSKKGAVISTQIIRAPMKGEPEGFFAEIDKNLKDHASNHAIELGQAIPVPSKGQPGLFLRLLMTPKEKLLSSEQVAVIENVTAPVPEPEKTD